MSQSRHLRRRSNVLYYHRRVPLDLVQRFGKSLISFSLGTSDPKAARKKRDLEDLKLNAQFEKLRTAPSESGFGTHSFSPQAIIRIVQDYVESCDSKSKSRELSDSIGTETEREDIRQEIEQTRSILKNDGDPRGREWLYAEGTKILGHSLQSLDTQSVSVLHEILRRGLLELGQRREMRLDNDFSRSSINPMFGPREQSQNTFGEMADELLQLIAQEARANGTSAKWIDAQRANIALLKEIVGEGALIREVDYDACMKVRSVLGAIPANRNKLYPGLELGRSIQLADQHGKRKLSAVTQGEYLSTFRNVMSLAAKKRLISGNPAEGLRPLTRETLRAKDRREPLASEQLSGFFRGDFYHACARSNPARPYVADTEGWRFWMPLLALFLGLRGNEICQLLLSDIDQTKSGTWFVHVTNADENEEEEVSEKRVKTETSHRKVPIHPELISLGFLDFVRMQRSRKPEGRLFPTLKADKYGYFSKYPLRRFRETYFPQEIALRKRQSFHSLRHNYRDALRNAEVPKDALQGLGGWSQRGVVSDNYGDSENPDYLARYIERVEYPNLDLDFLFVGEEKT